MAHSPVRRGVRQRIAGSEALDLALGRFAMLDTDGALDALDAWIASLVTRGLSDASTSYLLFDAACQAHRIAESVRSGAGLSEDRRLLLAQRLGVCDTFKESAEVFREAMEGISKALAAGPGRSAVVERAREFIAGNYMRRISLSEVAGVAGVSANYLSHLFRRQCGATVTHFVNRLRVREALRLIQSGEKRISEIASLVGYQNYRDFHRNFVKYEKSPPRRFRPHSPARFESGA